MSENPVFPDEILIHIMSFLPELYRREMRLLTIRIAYDQSFMNHIQIRKSIDSGWKNFSREHGACIKHLVINSNNIISWRRYPNLETLTINFVGRHGEIDLTDTSIQNLIINNVRVTKDSKLYITLPEKLTSLILGYEDINRALRSDDDSDNEMHSLVDGEPSDSDDSMDSLSDSDSGFDSDSDFEDLRDGIFKLYISDMTMPKLKTLFNPSNVEIICDHDILESVEIIVMIGKENAPYKDRLTNVKEIYLEDDRANTSIISSCTKVYILSRFLSNIGFNNDLSQLTIASIDRLDLSSYIQLKKLMIFTSCGLGINTSDWKNIILPDIIFDKFFCERCSPRIKAKHICFMDTDVGHIEFRKKYLQKITVYSNGHLESKCKKIMAIYAKYVKSVVYAGTYFSTRYLRTYLKMYPNLQKIYYKVYANLHIDRLKYPEIKFVACDYMKMMRNGLINVE